MLSGRRVLAIVNPTSGRGRIESIEDALAHAAARLGARVSQRRTEAIGDASRWAREAAAEGFELVLAVGGDGTVGAVAQGLLESGAELPLGVVPTGTGNGLARVLRLPLDVPRCLTALESGRLVGLDVMRRVSDGRVALVFFGAGLDAEINRDASGASKAKLGFLAYLVAGVRNLRGRRNHRIRLTLDGRHETLAAHTVTLFNAASLELAGLDVGPAVDPHDGALDVAVLRNPGVLRSLAAVLRLVSGPRGVGTLRHARHVRLEATPPLLVHADGDVVTGACGFLGCNLVEGLMRRGRDVVAVDRAAAWPPDALAAFEALPGRLRFVAADVREPDVVSAALAHAGGPIDALVHAAAITPGPEREAREALAVAHVNVVGTLSVLEAARDAGVRRLLYPSSASVYGDAAFPDDDVLDEARDAPRPTTVYGVAKFAAERLALRARSLWGMDVIAVRIGGAFGPWEHDSGARDTLSGPMLVTRALLHGERLSVAAGGHHDWVYALDVADAITALLDAPALRHELYHLSGARRWTVAEWSVAVSDALTRRGRTPSSSGPLRTMAVDERPRATLSIERLRPHHEPRFDLHEAVEHYLDWLEQRSPAWYASW